MKHVPDHSAGTGALPSEKRDFILALLLVLAVIVVYLPVWPAGFIWDDDDHLTKNPCIIGPLGLKEIWTTSAARICPLVLTTFWVEHAIWGLRPLPYHLVNMLLHAASAIVLWRVLCRLGVPGAWLGAALWALHPVQAESVAWVTELKNTQSGLFYLLGIFFFARWLAAVREEEHNPDRWNYALAMLCGGLAMASKSSTVVLPLVLCLCAWWLERGWKWRNAASLAPFFLMAALTSVLAMWTQHVEGANDPEWARSLIERLEVAGRVVWFYLGKLLWPHPLIFVYPRWQMDAGQFASGLPSLAVVLVLFVLWWNRRGPLRPFFFTLACFLAALLPVLGIVDHYFLRYSFVGDHFQYLASMAPLALAGAGIVWLAGWFGQKGSWPMTAFGAGVLLALGTLTWRQAGIYRNAETLWADTLQKNPGCWMACDNLGTVLFQQGSAAGAIAQYQKALAIKPDDEVAYDDLANVFLQQGRTDEAITAYQQALRFKPNFAGALNNLGNALLQKGNVDEAISLFKKVLLLKPGYAEAINNLGNALFQKGDVDGAVAQYEQALQTDPGYAQAEYNLGVALLQKGNVDEAIGHYRQALKTRPDYVDAINNLGNALLQKGEVEEAIGQYRRLLQLKPDDLEAANNLAWILATAAPAALRNGPQAVVLAERSNQLSGGGSPVILRTLAAAYAEAGRFDDARQNAQKAMELARAAGQSGLGEQIQGELKLYAAGLPFHQDSQ